MQGTVLGNGACETLQEKNENQRFALFHPAKPPHMSLRCHPPQPMIQLDVLAILEFTTICVGEMIHCVKPLELAEDTCINACCHIGTVVSCIGKRRNETS